MFNPNLNIMISYILSVFVLLDIKEKTLLIMHCTRHSTCPFFCQHSVRPIRWQHCAYR